MEHWKDMYDPAYSLRGGAAGHTPEAEARRKGLVDSYVPVRRVEGRSGGGAIERCRRRGRGE